MKFATDLDGVLNDFYKYIKERVKNITGYNLPEEPNTFDLRIPGYSKEEISKFIDQAVLESINVEPNLFNIKFLGKISKIFKEPVLIITSRKRESEEVTKKWLDKFVLPYTKYEIRFTDGLISKSSLLDSDTLFFVDDFYINANDVADKVKISFLIRKKYNAGKKLKDNVLIIKNMKDVFLKTLEYVMENISVLKNNKTNPLEEILKYSHADNVFLYYIIDSAMSSSSISSYETLDKKKDTVLDKDKNKNEIEKEFDRMKKETKTESDEYEKVNKHITKTIQRTIYNS